MNKLCISVCALIFGCQSATAQNVGIGTSAPQSSAILDLNTTNKGFLVPRMTSAQRNSIASPAKGLLVFDNDGNSFYFHNGTAWANLTGGPLTLPYTTSVNSVTQGLGIINTGSGTGIYGAATIGSGVYGRADATGGKGITGLGLNGATAILASASTGLALDVVGNLKISGGNTNPSKGAILTSDANGNAVWKNYKISFSASGLHASMSTMYHNTPTRIQFKTEDYDDGNNYSKVGDNPNPINTSEFTAPIPGTYHFDVLFTARFENNGEKSEVRRFYLSLWLLRNGNYIQVASSSEYTGISDSNNDYSEKQYSLSKDLKLQSGDKVHVQFFYAEKNGLQAHSFPELMASSAHHYFNGHLVYAD